MTTTAPNPTTYRFKLGDIVNTQNGSATFYRVIKRTECYVTLGRIQSETVEHTDDYGQSGYDVPLNVLMSEDPKWAEHVEHSPECLTARTRIKLDEDGNEEAFIDGNWFQHVTPYDGKPKPYDTY